MAWFELSSRPLNHLSKTLSSDVAVTTSTTYLFMYVLRTLLYLTASPNPSLSLRTAAVQTSCNFMSIELPHSLIRSPAVVNAVLRAFTIPDHNATLKEQRVSMPKLPPYFPQSL